MDFHRKLSLGFVSPEDLNQITEEGDARDVRGERKTPRATAQQRKMLSKGSDGNSTSDTEPDYGELRPASKLLLPEVSEVLLGH